MNDGWQVRRLGHLVDVRGGATPSKDEPEFWGGDIPWVSPKDMKVMRLRSTIDHVTRRALSRTSLAMIPPGSVLMVTRGMILLHTVPVAVNEVPVTLNQDMKALLPRAGLASDFLAWFLIGANEALLARVEEAGHGTRALRSDQWRHLGVSLPDNETQARVATFLDGRTAAIDFLIAKKERLIELLQEKRQALITQAVTKGLDPSVPMRDSGVQWIGRVPANWAVRKLRFVATFQRGHDLPAEQRVDGPFPVVSSGGIIGSHDTAACVGPGIVTGRYGSIGNFQLVECNYWALNTALYTRRLWGNSPRFVCYALSSLSALFEMESKKSAVPGIDRNDIHVYAIAVPSRAEQDVIADHLDAAVLDVDRVVVANQTSVDRLREYRQALISAAVTGKLDVTKRGSHEHAEAD